MRVDFLSVSGQDFMSFGEFALRLGRAGLYLVEGVNLEDEGRSNGAAKSTLIVESIAWCLFGRTVRGLPLVDAVIRRDTLGCVVRVIFKTHQGKFRVTRRRTTTKTMLVVQKRQDGVWVGEPLGIDATQAFIESLLGMDWKTYCSAVVFGQGSVFKFSSLSDRERKQVLDTALGVDIYLRAADLASADRLEMDREWRPLEAELRTAERILEEAGASYQFHLNLAAQEDTERAEKKQLIAKLKKGLAEDAHFPHDELKTATAAWRDLRRDQASVTEKIRAEKVLAASIVTASTETGTCPLCGHTNSAAEVDELCRQHAAAMARVARLEAENKKLSQSVATTSAAVKELEDRLENYDQLVRTRSKRVARIQALEADLDTQLYQEQLAQTQVALEEARERVAALTEALGKLDRARRALDYVATILGPSGMSSAAIEHAVPVLNEAAARVSQAITRGTLRVFFSTVTKTKDGKEIDRLVLVVESLTGADSYVGSSTGEQASADLCAGIAVQSLAAGRVQVNLAIFDETLDHLDPIGGTRVLQHLRELADEKSVWFISHSEWVKDAIQFDDVVRVVRQDGVSRIEMT